MISQATAFQHTLSGRNIHMIESFFKKSSLRLSTSKSSIKTVAITGSTGLLGPALVVAFQQRNIKVIRLTTKPSSPSPSSSFTSKDNFITWNPATGIISNPELLDNVDVVINLAGENVGSGDGPFAFLGRWSDAKKEKILSSRVNSVKTLVSLFATMRNKPKAFLTASAIGYYGYTDSDTIYDDVSPLSSKPGQGFLAEVCNQIEIESKKAQALGIRTVPMRISAILSSKGGIIEKLLIPFKLGLGGNIGSGKQGFSWVAIDDCVRAIEFIVDNPSLSGPVNISAPNPTDNAGFTKAFGKALSRPTIIPMPVFVASTVFGEFGQELLLGGQKVVPTKLLDAGFKFDANNIYDGIKAAL